MFKKSFFLALILGLVLFFSVFAADSDNAGTYQLPSVNEKTIVYTITLSYSSTDSTDDLHTKAMRLDAWDRVTPITVQAWGNAASGIDVNIDAELSAELNDAQFVTSSTFDIDAAGAAAAKTDILPGALPDTTGYPPDLVAFLPYLRFEADGQAGNPSTAVIYIKVSVPVAEDLTEATVRTLAGFVSTS